MTLDDVSSLLHLPIIGQFYNIEELEFEEARSIIVEIVDVDGGKASVEMRDMHSPKVRLRHIYDEYYKKQ